ncbi:hypothetical protein like AT2G16050 [Hibiscus trionum]|uniref:DC1 domain-containing protein n=1 Tax=Hibiscus trionum TaxID=183268 RepID=A0A9W7HMS0_HIBTR|nr:hypothetical protein like AT2G16050 [Hibiscus trionum]
MPTLLEQNQLDGHQHELIPAKSEVPFSCDGCKELGFGPCYRCPETNCNYIVHPECHIPLPTLSSHQFFEGCYFQFHKESPTGPGTRICDICASDIHGFSYQCSDSKHDLHPHCANLPLAFSLPDSDTNIYLRERIRSRCLKCNSKKRSSDRVQGLSYVSSDGNLCYHVACLNEAHVENWRNGHLTPDVNANGESSRSLELQNLVPNQVARPRRSRAMRRLRWLFKFIKVVVSALFGDHITLVSTLFSFFQN